MVEKQFEGELEKIIEVRTVRISKPIKKFEYTSTAFKLKGKDIPSLISGRLVFKGIIFPDSINHKVKTKNTYPQSTKKKKSNFQSYSKKKYFYYQHN